MNPRYDDLGFGPKFRFTQTKQGDVAGATHAPLTSPWLPAEVTCSFSGEFLYLQTASSLLHLSAHVRRYPQCLGFNAPKATLIPVGTNIHIASPPLGEGTILRYLQCRCLAGHQQDRAPVAHRNHMLINTPFIGFLPSCLTSTLSVLPVITSQINCFHPNSCLKSFWENPFRIGDSRRTIGEEKYRMIDHATLNFKRIVSFMFF